MGKKVIMNNNNNFDFYDLNYSVNKYFDLGENYRLITQKGNFQFDMFFYYKQLNELFK